MFQVMWQLGDISERLGNLAKAHEWLSLIVTSQRGRPTDPGVLARLASIFSKSEDDTQAFHYNLESYRYWPVDMNVITWLGIYYVRQEMYEAAIPFFSRASQIQPNEVKWLLMVASCYRRMGSFHQVRGCPCFVPYHQESVLVIADTSFSNICSPCLFIFQTLTRQQSYYCDPYYCQRGPAPAQTGRHRDRRRSTVRIIGPSGRGEDLHHQHPPAPANPKKTQALKLYEEIHRAHPTDKECLRYLITICKEMKLPFEKYDDHLKKLEKYDAAIADAEKQERPGMGHEGEMEVFLSC